MKLKKPTIKQIKSESTKQSFERGQDYYKDGSVISANIIHNTISALVSGTEEYQVSIYSHFKEMNQYCTCPYSFEGICKHIVAVLLHTADHFEQMIQDEKKRKIEIDNLFLDISDKRLKEFLSNQMEYNNDLKEKFMDYFGKNYDISPRDCKSEINLSYKRAVGGTLFNLRAFSTFQCMNQSSVQLGCWSVKLGCFTVKFDRFQHSIQL